MTLLRRGLALLAGEHKKTYMAHEIGFAMKAGFIYYINKHTYL
jgi:hypothetical protein